MHTMHMKNIHWKYAAVSLATMGALLGGSIVHAQTTQNTVIPQYNGPSVNTGTESGTFGTTGTNALTGTTSGGVGAGTSGGVSQATGTTPGVPNTGAGGSAAQNIAILVLAGLIAIGGGAYLILQSRRSAR